MSIPASLQRSIRRPYLLWMMYVLVPLAILGLLVWSTLKEIANNPSREAATELGAYGPVTIRFTTSPYPPLPTGNVSLSFMPMNSRGRMLPVEGITYEYGPEGSEQPVNSGVAEEMSDGSGMFMGNAQFPSVGNWWVRLNITQGEAQGQVRFTVYVKPAQ